MDGSLVSHGRAWPLLSGERGEYQIAAGDVHAAGAQLAAMASATGPGGLLPEQVWDRTAPAGQPGFAPGTPTFSAPLLTSRLRNRTGPKPTRPVPPPLSELFS